MAKILISIGLGFLVAGLVLYFFPNAFNWFGRLPGDIRIKGEHGAFYFPLTTMIIISIILSLIGYFLRR